MVQGETNRVVVRDRLPIRFSFTGFEENRFLLRKPFSMTLSVGPVLRAFRPSGLVIMSHTHFYPASIF